MQMTPRSWLYKDEITGGLRPDKDRVADDSGQLSCPKGIRRNFYGEYWKQGERSECGSTKY